MGRRAGSAPAADVGGRGGGWGRLLSRSGRDPCRDGWLRGARYHGARLLFVNGGNCLIGGAAGIAAAG